MTERTSALAFDTAERAGLAAAMDAYAEAQAQADAAAAFVRLAIEAVGVAEGGVGRSISGARLFSDAPPPAPKPGLSPAGMRAWNSALVKTGIEFADLDMLRRGRQGLKDTATPPAAPPNGHLPDAAD